jgi:hypothetical protein
MPHKTTESRISILGSRVTLSLHPSPEPTQRIIEFINDSFFQRNDSVVRDLDAFRANLRATLGDVAIPNALRVPQFFNAIFGIERMHLQRSDVNQEARPDEVIVLLMIAQHVANVLTKKTFDAFPELLHAINVFLRHAPRSIGRIRWARFESLDLFLHPKIPGHVRDQILCDRESFHRFDRYRFVQRQIAHACHAHELGHPVYFRRARAALACFAIPSAGEIVRLRALDVVHGIEHDHAFGDFRRVIAELSAARIAAPDFENGCFQS